MGTGNDPHFLLPSGFSCSLLYFSTEKDAAGMGVATAFAVGAQHGSEAYPCTARCYRFLR